MNGKRSQWIKNELSLGSIFKMTTNIMAPTSAMSSSSPASKDHSYVMLSQDPQDPKVPPEKSSSLIQKLSSALFYAICSFLITVINKIVLTSYKFPSYTILGAGQIIAILVILQVASQLNAITIRRVPQGQDGKIYTLALFYFGNLISGLGGTKHLPLPMFVALRRFSIAMTAIGEFYVLRVRQTIPVILTIIAMIAGAFVAAISDLTFNSLGYLLVTVNNFFSAANGVYTKKALNSKEFNKHEILYYNALICLIPMILVCILSNSLDEIYSFNLWLDLGFLVSFITSCIMGYLLMYSTVLCTHHNSALTTTIVGTLKNILTTYVGIYIGGDYKYSTMNFIGLNISLIGSLVYSFLTFKAKSEPQRQVNKA